MRVCRFGLWYSPPPRKLNLRHNEVNISVFRFFFGRRGGGGIVIKDDVVRVLWKDREGKVSERYNNKKKERLWEYFSGIGGGGK